MKKSLFSMGIAALLASTGTAALAGNVTIPNTFTSGTPALAAEVNDNFTAVETAVNGNATDISANTTAVDANTTAIGTNTTAIGDNTTAIGDNTTAIGDNATAITDLQNGVTCAGEDATDDMVQIGAVCIDKYESSVWDTAAGGVTQYGDGTADYPCSPDGSDCSKNAATPLPIYARSQLGVNPSVEMTWYQAVQACANVGKRLPTTAEWQMAASGTPSGLNTDPAAGCNTSSIAVPQAVSATGTAGALCQSSGGAADMVGNVFELVAELNAAYVTPGSLITFMGSDSLNTRTFGADFRNSGGLPADTESTLILDGPLITADSVGFRCVR